MKTQKELPKRVGGAWAVCRFKGGLGKEEGGSVLEGVFIPPIHTMVYVCF